MKTGISIIYILFLSSTIIIGQQLPYASQFNETRAYWNPAATAYGEEMKSTLFLREQWVNFNNSPRTGFVSIEYPFSKHNMSGGASLIFDQTGPVSKVGLQFNYAYKINSVFTRDGQLSAGLGGGFSQYRFDPSGIVVKDREDPFAESGRSSSYFPSATIGIFYISNPKTNNNESVFFFGVSYSQIYAGDILIDANNQKRHSHLFLEVGKRFQKYNSFIEPSIMLNYTNPEIITLTISTKYEMEDVFWTGLGYSSTKDLSIQGGIIIPEFGSRYGYLRLGVLANYGISDNTSAFGAGFEGLASYIYELD